MNNQPLISIIVPTYNTEKYLKEALDSVLSQTYQNWECIIIDDGSTDDTKNILINGYSQDPRFHLIFKSNKGVSKARNIGIDRAKGDYIAFLDSDDVWLPHHLSHLLEKLESNNVDFAYSKSLCIKGMTYTKQYTKHHQVRFGILQGKDFIEHLLKNNDIDTPMVLCKKEVLLNCDKFSFHKNAEDLFAWLSILLNGNTFYSSSETTGYVRIRDNSTSSIDRFCSKELIEIVFLLKEKLKNIGINYNYYFSLWARRYFLVHNDKTHYITAIKYINSYDSKYFSLLKDIASFLPKKILKILTLLELKYK